MLLRRLWILIPALAILALALSRPHLSAQASVKVPTGRLAGPGPFVPDEILISLTPAAARSAQLDTAAGTFGVSALDALGVQVGAVLVGPVFADAADGDVIA